MWDFYIRILTPAIFGAVAIFFVCVSLSGLISRRPFLISSRWLVALLTIGIAPSILNPFFMSPIVSESRSAGLLIWVGPVLMIVAIVCLWMQLRGFMAFGVTDESFREGLVAGLHALDLTFEESLSVIKIPAKEVHLQVSVTAWTGTGQVKSKENQGRPLLGELVKRMNEYFRKSQIQTNPTTFVLYLVVGVCMALAAGALFSL